MHTFRLKFQKAVLTALLILLPLKEGFAQELAPQPLSVGVGVFGRGAGLGVGARSMGMGGAFSAIANDGSAPFWNPGGFGLVRRVQVYEALGLLFNSKRYTNYFAISVPTSQGFSVALSMENRFPGSLNEDSNFPNIDISETIVGLTFAVPMIRPDVMGVGLTLKSLSGVVGNVTKEKVGGLGADFGMLYKIKLDFPPYITDLALALVITDLNTQVRWNKGGEQPVTRHAILGVAVHTFKSIRIALDYDVTDNHVIPGEEDRRIRAGMEGWMADGRIGLRLGYAAFKTSPSPFTVGMSYRGRDLTVDYAFLGHGADLGNSHRISFGYKFGEIPMAFPPGESQAKPTVPGQAPLSITAQVPQRAGKKVQDATPERAPKSRLRGPKGVQTLQGNRLVFLQWEKVEGAQGYHAYMRKKGDKQFRSVDEKMGMKMLEKTELLIPGVPNGVLLEFEITAVYSGDRESRRTQTISAKAAAPPAALKQILAKVDALQRSIKLDEAMAILIKVQEKLPNNYEIHKKIRDIRVDKMILNK